MIIMHINILVWYKSYIVPYKSNIYHKVIYLSMNHIILIALVVIAFTAIPALAANDSMNVDDIQNVKPSIPFAGGLLSMVIGIVKWCAVAGFIIALFSIVAGGTIATAMDNADWSEKSQNQLFMIAKIIGLAAIVYLAGVYIFATYL